MMYKLPLKFILLWILNLAVLVALGILLDIRASLYIRDIAIIYLVLGGILALLELLEQYLFDKIGGTDFPGGKKDDGKILTGG